MSEKTPEEALQNFADWMSPMDPAEIESVYGLTHKHAYLVLCELRQLRTALADANKRAEDLQAHYDRDTAKLQQEIARLTAANGGNYWRWQGDGGDYLESLTCPILIDVGQLHEILSVNRDAVVRAEEAEQSFATRVKEYREKVEQLETDKAFYHDKWLNALERLKAAEQEDARLREGIETTINYVRTGVHCRMIDHKMDSCDCEKISDEFAALLAQSEGGPDA